jgi:hypothetical protein
MGSKHGEFRMQFVPCLLNLRADQDFAKGVAALRAARITESPDGSYGTVMGSLGLSPNAVPSCQAISEIERAFNCLARLVAEASRVRRYPEGRPSPFFCIYCIGVSTSRRATNLHVTHDIHACSSRPANTIGMS